MPLLKLNYNTAMFRLCFNSKTSGTIIGQRLFKAIPFADLPEMLLKIDLVMDAQDYPRAFQRKREFAGAPKREYNVPFAKSEEEMLSAEQIESRTGSAGTLMLQVLTRQNATWQGFIIAGETRHTFDSVLQLLELIDGLVE